MKKYAVVTAVVALLIPVFCFAQEQGKGKCPYMQQKGMADGMPGKPQQGMDGMMCMKQCLKAGGSMVASDKGGVIVLLGGWLYKFDKELNLIKKTPVPAD